VSFVTFSVFLHLIADSDVGLRRQWLLPSNGQETPAALLMIKQDQNKLFD
jgi:hypothetical protein